MTNSVGRPISIDEMTLKILEDAFSNGATDVEACFLANISGQTLYNYQKKHPDFIERKQALKDMIKYQAKRNVVDRIKSGDIQQSNWWLDRKGKDEGFNVRQEVTGADGKDLTIQVIKYGDYNNSLQLPTETLPDTTTEGN